MTRESDPANLTAYDLYLRGRQLGREPTRAGLLRAIEQFEEALTLDPRFAAAYSGIAEAWTWLEDYGGVPAELMDKGKTLGDAAVNAIFMGSGALSEERSEQLTASEQAIVEQEVAGGHGVGGDAVRRGPGCQ